MNENSINDILKISPLGYAYHKIITDNNGKPIDYIFLEVNDAFEKLTGLKKDKIINKSVKNVIPGIELSKFDWINFYGDIALKGGNATIEQFSEKLNRYYHVQVSSDKVNYFSTIFFDITDRKKIEQDLLIKQTDFLNILSAFPGIIYKCKYDNNWTMLYLNRNVFSITGYPETDFLNNKKRSFESIIHREDSNIVKDKIDFAIKNNIPWEIEYRLIHQSGKIVWVNDRGQTLKNQLNEVEFLNGFILDISEKKNAEENLIKSKNLLNATEKLAKIGGWEWDIKHETMTWTDETYNIHDIIPGTLQGKSELIERSIACYEPSDREIIKSAFLKCIEKGESYNLEFEITTEKNKKVWIKTMGKPVKENNRIVKISGNIIDITEQKNAERELLLKDNIINSSKSVIATCDLKGNMTYANPYFLKLWGFNDNQEFLGKPFTDFWLLDNQYNKIMNDLLNNGIWEGELKARKKDGTLFDVQVSAASILDKKGNPIALTSTTIDITERKLAENALLASERRFKELIKNSSDSIVILDKNGLQLYVSDVVEKILGFKPIELINIQVIDEMIHPEDQAHVKEAFSKIIKEGKGTARYRHKHKNGSWVYLEAWATNQLQNPDIRGIVANVRDITEQNRINKALSESEERFRTFIDNSYDALFIHEIDGTLIDVNKTMMKMYNVTYEEALSYTIKDYTGQDCDFNAVSKLWNEVLEGKDQFFEWQARRPKDGSLFDIEVYLTRVTVFGTKIILANVRDITDRKKSEKALKESELFLSESQKIGHIGSFQLDFKTNKFIWSDEVFRIFGINPYPIELYYNDFLEFVHSEDKNNVNNAFQNSIKENKNSCEIEYRIILKHNNEIRYISHKCKHERNENNEIIKSFGIIQDITDTKNSEQALLESETRFKALHNASFGGIAIHDKGIILECNQGLSDMTGYSVEELIGMNGLLLISEKSRDLVMKNILSGYEKPYEAIGLHKNGKEYYLRVEARNIPYKGKNVRTTEFRDITERKNAEIEQAKLQQQLIQSQKMESIGRLAGGVAHDFNNMLTVILGYTNTILESTETTDKIYSNLQEILNAANRSAALTKQLLTFARKQVIEPKVLDLNTTIDNMANMLCRLIGENIDLLFNPRKNLWNIKVDPSQIDQILINLCVNAKDAIKGIGNIIIETDKVTFDKSYCRNHSKFLPGEYVVLSINDDGCGMDSDTLDKLFEPFFTTKEIGKGTGLGLATVYGIVNQNKGIIDVSSEINKGSTFKIYFPRYLDETKEVKINTNQNVLRGKGETILIVEDEKAILNMLEKIIISLGYSVLTATKPSEAIELAETKEKLIDVLITDVIMPEMNGQDLAKKLNEIYPKLKFLFMSGYTYNVISHEGILDEGINFIQKPFSKSELALKIHNILNKD